LHFSDAEFVVGALDPRGKLVTTEHDARAPCRSPDLQAVRSPAQMSNGSRLAGGASGQLQRGS
jgi:hypothetical protein